MGIDNECEFERFQAGWALRFLLQREPALRVWRGMRWVTRGANAKGLRVIGTTEITHAHRERDALAHAHRVNADGERLYIKLGWGWAALPSFLAWAFLFGFGSGTSRVSLRAVLLAWLWPSRSGPPGPEFSVIRDPLFWINEYILGVIETRHEGCIGSSARVRMVDARESAVGSFDHFDRGLLVHLE
jgi:hypothetical protein